MKHLLSIIILLYSCSSPQNKKVPTKSTPIDSTTTVAKPDSFQPLEKLSTTGDFNGDGKQDTLYQHNISRLTNAEIDSIPIFPEPDGYFPLMHWLNEQQADVYLTMNYPTPETLHLGAGLGLYFLHNLGDLNNDGKDEVALVVDYADMSNINTCNIYSLCNGKWKEVKYFTVNESFITYTTDAKPKFANIKDGLEKRNGMWYYMDYQKMIIGERQEDLEMKPLTVEICK